MINEINQDAQQRMQKSIAALKDSLAKIRTGRANPGLLAHIMVSYYGTDTPLSQVASVGVNDARTLTVTPWEDAMVQPIEKAIMTADLGLNPATSGKLIRIPLPPLTEERRKEFVRLVREDVEKIRVSIRNIRRDANNDFKDLLKEKKISEDEERRAQDKIQKLTDQYIANAEALLKTKEEELMQV